MFSESDFTYRRLTSDDDKIYSKLVNTSSTMMAINKKSIGLTEDNFLKNLFDDSQFVTGAFDKQNNLIASVTGYFHDSLPHWYLHASLFDTPGKNLYMYKVSGYIFKECVNMIIDYAEEKEYFSFYSRRTIKDQLNHESIASRLNRHQRYYFCHEKIYKAGEICKFKTHQPLFNFDFNIDTIVSINILKPEYRKEILDKQYNYL